MPKAITDIKAASNELARRAKLGQIDERTLVATLNDLVNFIYTKETTPTTLGPAPQGPTAAEVAPVVEAAQAAVDAAAKPKRQRRVKVGSGNAPDPVATVGTQAADTSKPAAEPGAGETRTIPLNVRVGRGVRVGTAAPANSGGVTVGSAPVNPAGQVTVGGRVVSK